MRLKLIRAWFLLQYLVPGSANLLNIDAGLIEALNIRLQDATIQPDVSWFESICKFIYEKIKNEEIFLNNFYQSSAYRKLLLELEFYNNLGAEGEFDPSIGSSLSQMDTGSDSNSGDIQSDDEIDFVLDSHTLTTVTSSSISAATAAAAIVSNVPASQTVSPKNSNHHQQQSSESSSPTASINLIPKLMRPETLAATAVDIGLIPFGEQTNLLSVMPTKHFRSHSDCTGLVNNMADIQIEPLSSIAAAYAEPKSSLLIASKSTSDPVPSASATDLDIIVVPYRPRLAAKIINTAINCEGQYAVYAIQVTVTEDDQQKSWHVYRRYSKFLELKKILVKRVRSPENSDWKNRLLTVLVLAFSIQRSAKFRFPLRKHFKILSEAFSSIG